MKNFLEWMISEAVANIVFTRWSKDGTIVAVANGRRYKFVTDAVYHHRWKSQARFAPGRVFNEILGQVKTGNAQQVEPPVASPRPEKCATCGPEESCPICGTQAPNYNPGVECPSCGYKE